MKKIAFIIAALGLSVSASAELPWLTFTLSDGTAQSVAAEGLELTVSGENLVAGELTLPLAQLSFMEFTETAADGSSTVTPDPDPDPEVTPDPDPEPTPDPEPDVTPDQGEDGITGVTADGQNAVIYDLQGRRVTRPGKGLYIINNKLVNLQ